MAKTSTPAQERVGVLSSSQRWQITQLKAETEAGEGGSTFLLTRLRLFAYYCRRKLLSVAPVWRLSAMYSPPGQLPGARPCVTVLEPVTV